MDRAALIPAVLASAELSCDGDSLSVFGMGLRAYVRNAWHSTLLLGLGTYWLTALFYSNEVFRSCHP